MDHRSQLRVGILIDSYVQPRWIHHVISEIQNSAIAKIVLVVLNRANTPRQNIFSSLWRQRRYFLYKTYTRIDREVFKRNPDAFEKYDIREILQEASFLSVLPVQKKYSDYFEDSDLDKIRDHQLDVLLRFGFRILRGQILTVPRFGVWSYHHGDNLVYRGGPPGFWEVMRRDPVTGSVLQVLTESLDAGKVLYKSYSRTDMFSVARSKNRYYWKSAAFVLRKLHELSENGNGFINEKIEEESLSSSDPINKKPTNVEFLPLLSKFIVRNLSDKSRDLVKRNQWFLAYSLKKGKKDSTGSLFRYEPMIPPRDRYWADPFPIKIQDKYFIFLEEFIYKKGKGHISVMEMDERGTYTGPTPVMTSETHLSYPFLLEWNNNYFMIPETAQKRQVELYRCESFPHEWKFEAVLLENKNAVDATLVQVDGVWWMFVNIAERGASTFDELHLYYSTSPLGPWKAHRRNPVKSDCRSARPAGNLVWHDKQLYRPAQDCSVRYGYAVSLNRILKLNKETFEETEVQKIWPRWKEGLLATHMINTSGDLTVIDGMHRVSRVGFGRSKLSHRKQSSRPEFDAGGNIIWNR